jgi:hypothetical protein
MPFTDNDLKWLEELMKLIGPNCWGSVLGMSDARAFNLSALLARLEAAEEAMDEFKAHKKYDCAECALVDEVWRKAAGK